MALQSYLYEPFFSFEDVYRLLEESYRDNVPELPSERKTPRRRCGHGHAASERPATYNPKIDVYESTEDNLVTATFELPGLTKKDITVDLQGNRLVVSGEIKPSAHKEESGYTTKERRGGKFSRAVTVPQGTNPEDILASMEYGVLTLMYPKSSQEQDAKLITIL